MRQGATQVLPKAPSDPQHTDMYVSGVVLLALTLNACSTKTNNDKKKHTTGDGNTSAASPKNSASSSESKSREHSLVLAASKGDSEEVSRLLTSGIKADVEVEGVTALILATLNGHDKVVDVLLLAGANTEKGIKNSHLNNVESLQQE